uniref:BZIP domain-containing protein n=1 Tax=Phytophthora ramorum TaxID=164328 RepID=H3GX48_PHYRM
MNVCTLYPPSRRQLSDDVIGSVKQRAWLSDDCIEEGGDENIITGNAFQQPHDRPQLYEEALEEHSIVAQGGVYNALHGGTSMEAEQKERGTASSLARQREKRRLRQIRYRKKKYAVLTHLEEDTQQLREEVQSLEQRRRDISASLPIWKSVWDIALRYFEIFRFGLQGSSLQSQSSTTSSSSQLDFVLTTLAPDVEHNAGRGVETMMRSWWCLSHWFGRFDLELEGLMKGNNSSLDATTTTSVTITEQTLRKRIVMRGSVHFQLDNANGRVTSVTAQSDMLTPMLRLLGDLEDVSCVFEKALISPGFHWKMAI